MPYDDEPLEGPLVGTSSLAPNVALPPVAREASPRSAKHPFQTEKSVRSTENPPGR